jgi:heme/copper-type cytochrome/quinol oxidase subunit 2
VYNEKAFPIIAPIARAGRPCHEHHHPIAWASALLTLLAFCTGARATSPLPLAFGREWWLNTNYAEHGKSVDQIFLFIFWLTTAILVLVQIGLVWFMIKYRHKPGCGKAVYLHGNTRLEMIWTLIPAVILVVLALWSKQVWDNYRYSPSANDPDRYQVLVVGEQFKWNVIYPGPKGKIGRFLIYPKTTDLAWPTVPPGKAFRFPNVPGPAYLPEEQARGVLKNYITDINPLGRDYSDPDTDPLLPEDRRRFDELLKKSDPSADEQKELETLKEAESLNDYSKANGRPLVIPRGRPVEIQIGSRDVIHDFFIPNFRVRLDTVPGMRGKLYLTATKTCKEISGGARPYNISELESLLTKDPKAFITAVVNEKSPGTEHYVS